MKENLINKRDKSDPGDDTALRYRYQFAYGIILLVGSSIKDLDYEAIWCEQHEDFLGQISSKLFDAYQVKTRKPELGYWVTGDKQFTQSVKRFVGHDKKFPGSIRKFKFVSNTDFFNTSKAEDFKKSPQKLLDEVVLAKEVKTMPLWAINCIGKLAKTVEKTEDEVFAVLKRLDLVKGPSLESFDAEICQNVLPKINLCRHLDTRKLAQIKKAILNRVHTASSLGSQSLNRFYVAINREFEKDSNLLNKRIDQQELVLIIQLYAGNAQLYPAELGTLKLKNDKKKSTLKQKMKKGGLAYYFETMRRRAIKSEGELLEICCSDPEKAGSMVSQLECIVKGVCDDAHLKASMSDEPYGKKMLASVIDQLNEITSNRSQDVFFKSRDVLLGVGGLLTDDCQVWWSGEFDLEESK